MFRKPPATIAPTDNGAGGTVATRLHTLVRRLVQRPPSTTGHPPAAPALGAFGLLVGDGHHNRS